jgi:uncharacterized protein YndB with AHSA1/START domain
MIDVRHQISAVRRTLGDRTLEAGEARVLTISQIYDTDQDDLWEVVTDPDRIARWFLPVTGELKVGGHYQFEGNAGGTVTRCDKPDGFAATWEFGGLVSWVEVRLVPEGGGRTRFELEHVAHVEDDVWEQFGPGATGVGWEMGLLGLALYLSGPRDELDRDAVMAWVVSDEGRTLMRLSSEAWAEAAIQYGDDPAAAQARADRVYAAYTGG